MLDGKVKDSHYRLMYHITPEKGLLNDPNGLIKFKGKYHVFYQWNPHGTVHKNKTWGHVISDNMVNWERLPAALSPSEIYDKDGIYSGSAIVKEGILYLFYTGNVIIDQNVKKSYQCLATSEDGIHFEKKGPIIEHPEGYTRHVRDPKVWLDEKETFWMILGAQTEDLKGEVLVYRSEDLIHWESRGNINRQKKISLGYMWECPDLLRFESGDVLLISPQGIKAEPKRFDNINQTGYMLGEFLDSGEFVADSFEFTELDRGFEFYAPQSFQDGDRTILYGWMGAMPNDIEQTVPTVSEGWLHCLSIPRTIELIDHIVYQKPVEELKQLRLDYQKLSISITNKDEYKFTTNTPYNEIVLNFCNPTNGFTLDISGGFFIEHNNKENEIIISRINWLTNEMEKRIGKYEGELKNIRIYLDGSTIEIFVNDGSLVFSSRYFVEKKNTREFIFKGDLRGIEGIVYPLEFQT